MKKLSILFLWFLTIIYAVLWTFENPEKVEKIKNEFKKNEKVETEVISGESKYIFANSFKIKLSQVLKNNSKTAFLVYPNNIKKFDNFSIRLFSH